MNSISEPRQLFLDTLSDFHKNMGDRKFWSSVQAQDIAIEALAQDYMRVEHGEHLNLDATFLQSALQEYELRKAYLVGGRRDNATKSRTLWLVKNR